MKNPDVEFLLPGSWTFLPLADEAATKRVIARLAEDALGRADRQARLRAELREQFADMAHRSRKAGGEAMWMCRELVPGVPLPVTLVLYRPALAIPTATTSQAALDGLRSLIGPPGEGVDEVELTAGGRPAVRRAKLLTGRPVDDPEAPDVETVESVYWIVQPDGRSVASLVFGVAMPRLREKLVELFDQIIFTMKWGSTSPAPAAEPVAPEPAEAVSA